MLFRHVVYLLIYIGCGAAFTLLVKGSQSLGSNGKVEYKYEPVLVTMSVELFKLCSSLIYVLFFVDPSVTPRDKLNQLISKLHVAKLFAIPAFLYFVFNALAFWNLNLVQPATYRLLINLKVLFSGIMLRIIIGTQLSARQWVALLILLFACGIEQIDSFDYNTGLFAILLIAFQAMCSSAAGVYFQLLLQKGNNAEAAQLGLWEKNVYMYSWSVIFNLFYLFLFAPDTFFNPSKSLATFDFMVVPIILASGVGGFSTSLILRDLDVIIKEYANFVEMVVVVVGSWMFLSVKLHLTLFVAVGLVTASLWLYNVPAAESVASAPEKSRAVELEKLTGGAAEGTDIEEALTEDAVVQRPLISNRGRDAPQL
jgi:UDP-sugar transporter A1/2/3